MLFNSFEFLLLFLPCTLLLFYGVRHYLGNRASRGVLVAASLCFYGYWSSLYLLVLVASLLFNYGIGLALIRGVRHPKAVLTAGIAFDLGLLGYFKYANFFVDTLNQVAGTAWDLGAIVLPLGISFFTFQQISYRIECYYGRRKNDAFLDYCAAVTFFPHLIAGPIVLYQELMPQFHERKHANAPFSENFPIGASIFAVGLFKKVIIADSLAVFASPMFASAAGGTAPAFYEAWGGALAYTFQLYFDFSGYCDMAVGLAYMFGIRLPANFNSPYKATSIIDFWRRWHITLSRFLRSYLYIPLGGNRRGLALQCRNLMITMLLGGLWHGAGWGFVLWGALHGGAMVLNHLWRHFLAPSRARLGHSAMYGALARALTFVFVVLAWVPFRATDLGSTRIIWESMFSPGGAGFLHPSAGAWSLWLLASAVLVWAAPNTIQIFRGYYGLAPAPTAAPPVLTWRPSARWALTVAGLGAVSFLSLNKVSEFLYFQF